MKILLTGATGYIGKRLLPVLVEAGHHVVCCVRDLNRFIPPESLKKNISIIQLDLLDKATLSNIPIDIDGAYYLVHSMSTSSKYKKLEHESAVNFRGAMMQTNVKHIVYLSGIINDNNLSEHLASRKNVEIELGKGNYNFTTLRAGIVIGSGSASFEIIRYLVEELPIMVAPRWLQTRCQPIAIADVIAFLSKALFNEKTFNQSFDIGGPDIVNYKEMLLGFSKARKLNRRVYIVPVMTPRLSSYWLYFVTSTSYKLAVSLVDSMKVEVVCRNTDINGILDVAPMSYQESLRRAFSKIENNEIVSSWKDAYVSSGMNINISDFINIPTFGCLTDTRKTSFDNREDCINRIWSIGGANGWYYADGLWKIRGMMDKLVGGVGLRRGRTNLNTLNAGDALDFWRVLFADKEQGRLLLFAEMKLPGEAWLEFKIVDNELMQTATFRPLGLLGRMYWYSLVPVHGVIFGGMLNRLAKENKSKHSYPS